MADIGTIVGELVAASTDGVANQIDKYILPDASTYDDDAPVEWLIKGYFLRGKLILIDAAGGSGKTRLTLAVAGCLAQGYCPLITDEDDQPESVGKMLLIGDEDDERELAKVYRNMGYDPKSLIVFNPTGVNAKKLGINSLDLTPEGLETLEAIILANMVTAFSYDPVLPYLPKDVKGAVDPQGVSRVLAQLQAVCSQTNATGFLVRHFSKQKNGVDINQYGAGTDAWRNKSRGQWVLLPHPDSRTRKDWMQTLCVSGRNTITTRFEPMFAIEVDRGRQTWIRSDQIKLEPYYEAFPQLRAFLGEPPTAPPPSTGRSNEQLNAAIKAIVKYLNGRKRVGYPNAIIAALADQGLKRATVYRAKAWMVKEGLLAEGCGAWQLTMECDEYDDATAHLFS